MRNRPRYFAYALLFLLIAQPIVIVLSWMFNAFFPQAGIRSLITSWGMRWYIGHFVDNVRIPFLVWAILLSMAFGAYHVSGLHHAVVSLFKRQPLKDKQPLALRITALVMLLLAVTVFFLALQPHALLHNVSGGLFPSSFSEFLIPLLALIIMTGSLCFAFVSGWLDSAEKFYQLHVNGIKHIAWLFPLYILAAQLYASAFWVLGFS